MEFYHVKFKSIAIGIFLLNLAGCMSFQSSVPEGYSGSTASMNDTYTHHTGSKAHFFVLTEVEDSLVENASYRTRLLNSGRKDELTPYMVSRTVTTQAQQFTIAGFVQHMEDGRTLAGDNMLVSGNVSFNPVASETYSVTGVLNEHHSRVWVEDSKGNIVSEKVVANVY